LRDCRISSCDKRSLLSARHSQVVATTYDPILPRNEATRPHGYIGQLKRLDRGLCLVTPYVDMAAVEGGKDPGLVLRTGCQLPFPCNRQPSSCSFCFVVALVYAVLVDAYLCRVEINALYSLAPGTVHVSVVSSVRRTCRGPVTTRVVHTRAASVVRERLG
jgi:hypothetical protein